MNDPAKDPNTPNVLLICCDHLRADWLSCNGHPVAMTPQMDKLAYQGVNFRQAFSECPVCVPARRILMTGLGPYAIHMNRNVDRQPFSEGPKLAEVMTRAGYQTFASGKLHTCPQRNRIGFEDVQLNEEGRKQDDARFVDDYEAFLNDSGYAHLAYTHGLGNNEYGVRMSPVPEPYTTTHWTAQEAMRFLERRDPTRPFFLYVSFDKPHPPITPPQEYYGLYREQEMPAPAWGTWLEDKLPESIRQKRLAHDMASGRIAPLIEQQTLRGYAALVTHIDSMIGVLLGTLREKGLLDNTHVLLTSDHGDTLFDHGNVAKSDFFRGSTGVPYLVRPAPTWGDEHDFRPDRTDTDRPVGLMDVMPTIMDLCGLETPESVEGSSLVPLLLDPGAPFREMTYGVCGTIYGVSDGRLKYMWFGDEGMAFLFDTQEDPAEEHDLAEDPAMAEQRGALREGLTAWMAEHGDPHVQEGVLTAIPPERRAGQGQADVGRADLNRARNVWNNRGRH